LYILANLARVSHRWCQLSSNVMPQKNFPTTSPPINIHKSQLEVLSGVWRGRAVGLVASEPGSALGREVRSVQCAFGAESIMFFGPAALGECWRMAGSVARRSEYLVGRCPGLRAGMKSSSLGRPPWGALTDFRLEQGGRLEVRGNSNGVLPELGSLRVAGKVHLARRRWLRHNTSLKRSAIGRPPVPGLLHTVHSHRPGPVVLPLSSA